MAALVAGGLLVAVFVRGAVSGYGALAEGRAALEAGQELRATVTLREAVSWYLPLWAPWREPASQALWSLHERQSEEGRLGDATRSLSALRSGLFAARSVLWPDQGWMERVDGAMAPLLARWEREAAREAGREAVGERGAREAHFAAQLARDPRPSRLWGLVAVLCFLSWIFAVGRASLGSGRQRWLSLAAAVVAFALFLLGVAWA